MFSAPNNTCPCLLQYYHYNLLLDCLSKDSSPYPISNDLNYDNIAPNHRQFLLNVTMLFTLFIFFKLSNLSNGKRNEMRRLKLWNILLLRVLFLSLMIIMLSGANGYTELKYKPNGIVNGYKAYLVTKEYSQ